MSVASINTFAVFVMTYKRPALLQNTINKILSQSLPPQKILIVDNDPERSAENIPVHFPENNVAYFSVGYNSGPAGAAYYGLKILADEGWDWIGWMDDDDPPFFEDTFQVLIRLANTNPQIGCVGSVGQRFNINTGLIQRLANNELMGEGLVLVDNIAGNMSKIVNSKVVKLKNVLPDKELFFGFEELDFDVRVKKAGFSLVCDKAHYLRHRVLHNRLVVNKKKHKRKSKLRLVRDYYSFRNMLFILQKQGSFLGISYLFFRSLFKVLSGFRFGMKFGISNLKVLSMAGFHFLLNKKGMRLKFPT